jgi:hypothetical protein
MSRDDSINLLIALASAAVLVTGLLMAHRQRIEDERVCRHAIQRNFGVERAEAERLIELERALER